MLTQVITLYACLLDTLVDDHSDGMLCYIVHNARPAVVRLVWQTFLHCSVALQIITEIH